MLTILKWILSGAGLGGLSAIGLFVIGFLFELMNLGVAILTCDCDAQTMFDWSGMGGLLLFCIIAGAIIGGVYGFYLVKTENDEEAAKLAAQQSEEARRQRIKWANEAKQKALSVHNTCTQNTVSDHPLVSAEYKARSQMAEIINELMRAAEKEGKVSALASELTRKGDGAV